MDKMYIDTLIKNELEDKMLVPIDDQVSDKCSSKIYYMPWDDKRNRFMVIRAIGLRINLRAEKKYYYI